MKLLLLPVFVAVLLTACGSGGSGGSYVVKNAVTDSNGQATFVDNTTGEVVVIYVQDSDGNALSNITVQFWDYSDHELFIVQDPYGIYDLSFRIYAHNSTHHITMHMSNDAPVIREVSNSSEEGQAINNVVQNAKRKWLYLGNKTPAQLDTENQTYLFILKLSGRDFTIVSDSAGKISEVSGLISGWEEPEYYDVYYIIPDDPVTTPIRVLIPVHASLRESTLISPQSSAELDNNCADRSDSIEWDFDWSDIQDATKYQIYIIREGAIFALVDTTVTSSSYHYSDPDGYIIDGNRLNWTWKVRAGNDNNEWSDWSDIRYFDVEPLNTDCP